MRYGYGGSQLKVDGLLKHKNRRTVYGTLEPVFGPANESQPASHPADIAAEQEAKVACEEQQEGPREYCCEAACEDGEGGAGVAGGSECRAGSAT